MKTELEKKLRSLSGILCGMSMIDSLFYIVTNFEPLIVKAGIFMGLGIALWIVS